MRRAAAFFVPWPGTFFNKRNSFIAFLLWYGAVEIHGFNAGKVIMPARLRIGVAHRTKEIGVRTFIPHDAAGYGGNALFF